MLFAQNPFLLPSRFHILTLIVKCKYIPSEPLNVLLRACLF
jgi:hypothetical protein